MICLNCRKQIPDNSAVCPFCGKEVFHEEQLPREISFRRYQRWFFYGLIVIVFLGMGAAMMKVYADYTSALENINVMKKDLTSAQAGLDDAKKNLDETNTTLADKAAQLEKALNDITAKEKRIRETEEKALEAEKKLASSTEEYKKVLDGKVAQNDDLQKYKAAMDEANANIYSLIIKLGTGITNKDLSRLPVADSGLNNGKDGDSDGLSDEVEAAIGSNKDKKDTDGDGFSDKDEFIRGYNYLGSGSLPIDAAFAHNYRGRMLLQVQAHGEAWYINPADNKRYFLGKPAEAFKAMSSLGLLKK